MEGARILAVVLTIPFGGCEPHVRGWLLPVFWGGFGAWLKPKIKFAWFVRNILGGRCFWVAAACRVLRVFVRFLSERHGFMKLSARNQFAGKVVEITEGATNGIVKIEVAPEVVISASITNESIKELGLKVGETAYAVIKASNVMVGADH